METLGRYAVAIDNTSLFLALRSFDPSYRIDFKKLMSKICSYAQPGDMLTEQIVFSSILDEEGPADKQHSFLHYLSTNGFTVHAHELDIVRTECPACRHRYEMKTEKSLATQIAIELIRRAHNNTFDTVFFVTGNGVYKTLVEELQWMRKTIHIVSFEDFLSLKLQDILKTDPIYLDKWLDAITI